MDDFERVMFSELQARKDARDPEESCDSCNGTGGIADNIVCSDCLGQGVLLTQEEYDLILDLAGVLREDDSILDAAIIE